MALDGWIILAGAGVSIVVLCLIWSSLSQDCLKCCFCCCEVRNDFGLVDEEEEEDVEKGKGGPRDEEQAKAPVTLPAPSRDLEAARFSGSARAFSKRSMESSTKSFSTRSMESLEENPYKDEKFAGKYVARSHAPRG